MAFASNHDPQAKLLIQEGIAAIKEGDKQLGRGKLEAAVKIDPYNEMAWLWLAKVVTTIEERRTCLGNVMLINPGNPEAEKMMEKIEDVAEKVAAKEEKSKRNRLVLGGAGVVGLLFICILGYVALGGGKKDVAVPTAFVTETYTPTADVNGTATAQASITPTATISPTITPAVINATWTFTPAPTETPPPQQFPTPPTEVSGRIIMQSGRVPGDDANQPIVMVEPGNLSSKQVISPNGQRGQLPALVTGQNRFAWAHYSSGTRSLILEVQEIGMPSSTVVNAIFGSNPILNEPNYPVWSGNKLVFSAQLYGAPVHDLWLLPIEDANLATPIPAFGEEQPTLEPTAIPPTVAPTATLPEPVGTEEVVAAATEEIEPTSASVIPAGSPLVRLTDKSGNNTWSAFDPTGTALVFVSEDDGATDLRVVNINSLQIFVLTDNKNALIESAPDWNNENEIIFSASTQDSENSDVYLMSADGKSEPTLLVDLGAHDIQPRFSPDGRYVVFSSDYYGNWDVFLYDRETETVYQVETNPQSTDIANDWTD